MHWIKYLIIWVSKFNVCIKQLIFNTSISNYLEKKHLFKFFRQSNYTEKAKILYFLNLLLFKFDRPMTTSCDLFTTDRPYVTLYDAIYKKGSKQIWVSVSLLSIFFSMELYTCEQEQMRNIIMKKNCLLFKHEKNNKTLSNDWPTYCHIGII